MQHRWIAAGSAPMTEDQALEWATDTSADTVTRAGLELVTHTLFCAVCDGFMGDAPDQCPGPPHPSMFPHHWRVKTTMMLDETEARDLYLERAKSLDSNIPQALNIYCDLCGEEFDPRLSRCSERAVLRADGSTISDEDLERLLAAGGEPSQGPSLEWRGARWIGHDDWIAIGDAGIDPQVYLEVLDRLALAGKVLNGTPDGYPVVACITDSDANLPVEIAADTAGEIEAVRVCWTVDVDKVDGRWSYVGRLSISSGRCRVWDPRHHLDDQGHVVQVRPGFYKVEMFEFDGDTLGLRIRKEERATRAPASDGTRGD